jgi:hypothetical protein
MQRGRAATDGWQEDRKIEDKKIKPEVCGSVRV